MPYVVGVDIGATNLRVVVADDSGTFLSHISERTVREGPGTALTAQVARLIKTALQNAGISEDAIKGIGIGSIGPLDLREGAIINTPNLPFDYVPLAKPLREKFGKPVNLLNDCTAAVVGERFFGAGKGLDNLVYITISTGIGGGAYVDGNLLIGKDGNAAEIGHMVIDPEGRLICGCGRPGHWEAYCSGSGIPKLTRLEIKKRNLTTSQTLVLQLAGGRLENITAKMVFDAAREGDSFAIDIIRMVGRYNAIGIANVINVYDPSLITIGGSVALKNKDLIFPYIHKFVDNFAVNRIPEIRPTPLGGDVVLYGAIAIALELERVRQPRR